MCAIFICILLLTFLLLIAKLPCQMPSPSFPLSLSLLTTHSKINSNVNRRCWNWSWVKWWGAVRGAGRGVQKQIAGHLVKCCNSNEYLCYESRLIFHLAFWLIEIALTIYMPMRVCVCVCGRKINTNLIAHMAERQNVNNIFRHKLKLPKCCDKRIKYHSNNNNTQSWICH